MISSTTSVYSPLLYGLLPVCGFLAWLWSLVACCFKFFHLNLTWSTVLLCPDPVAFTLSVTSIHIPLFTLVAPPSLFKATNYGVIIIPYTLQQCIGLSRCKIRPLFVHLSNSLVWSGQQLVFIGLAVTCYQLHN